MQILPERQSIIDVAESLLGAPGMRYVRGHPELGQSPEAGFDCSGFVRFVLAQSGFAVGSHLGPEAEIRETRHANELWDHYGITVDQDYALPGDLIFFSRQGWWPTHVGIYTGDNGY